MNFGKWITKKLNDHSVSQYRLEIDANLSKGCIFRWSQTSSPRLKSFVETCIQISKYSGEDLDSVILEAIKNTKEYKQVKK